MGDNLPAVNLGTGRTATAITAGNSHTCAVLDNGTVKCWGYNSDGQLGLGDTTDRGDDAGEMGDNLPGAVDLGHRSPSRSRRSAPAPGHTCARLDDGAPVKCWERHRLGRGATPTPRAAPATMGDNLPQMARQPRRPPTITQTAVQTVAVDHRGRSDRRAGSTRPSRHPRRHGR